MSTLGNGGQQSSRPLGGGRVGQHALDLGAARGADAVHGRIELGLAAADDEHLGALHGQGAGDFQADAGGRAGHQGGFVFEFEIHRGTPLLASP